jgi:hypothetical protein
MPTCYTNLGYNVFPNKIIFIPSPPPPLPRFFSVTVFISFETDRIYFIYIRRMVVDVSAILNKSKVQL